jgi:hypothetical protein
VSLAAWESWRGSGLPVGNRDGMVAVSELRGAIERGDALAAELERVTAALREAREERELAKSYLTHEQLDDYFVAVNHIAGAARPAQEDA